MTGTDHKRVIMMMMMQTLNNQSDVNNRHSDVVCHRTLMMSQLRVYPDNVFFFED